MLFPAPNSRSCYDVCSAAVGDFVLCEFEGSWSRAEIYQTNETKAVIGFLDYGNLKVVEPENLVPLPRHFSHHPAIAAKIHIDGVADPTDPNMRNQAAEYIKVCVSFRFLLSFYQSS